MKKNTSNSQILIIMQFNVPDQDADRAEVQQENDGSETPRRLLKDPEGIIKDGMESTTPDGKYSLLLLKLQNYSILGFVLIWLKIFQVCIRLGKLKKQYKKKV